MPSYLECDCRTWEKISLTQHWKPRSKRQESRGIFHRCPDFIVPACHKEMRRGQRKSVEEEDEDEQAVAQSSF